MPKNNRLKKLNWEFWPMWLANIPVCIIYLFFSVRARNMFFFSTVNPKFENGALMGASKMNILNALPKNYLPKTAYLRKGKNRIEDAISAMRMLDLKFPIIIKPDIGERGLLVEQIMNEQDLNAYLSANDINYILQEYISYPNEAAIFYHRLPNEQKGQITSIALKDYLTVVGDGKSSIRSLLVNHFHGSLQISRLEEIPSFNLNDIPRKGEEIILEPIGNHCRGTKISSGNHLISERLLTLFDEINRNSDDVYYGRYDLKYRSWEALLEGQDFKILELNGVASEPMHIYDSSIPVLDKYKSFYRLWKKIFLISKIQRKKGVKPMSAKDAARYLRNYFKYLKSINKTWRNNTAKQNLVLTQ